MALAKAKKTRAPRSPLSADEKYWGTEPVWDTERALKMDEAEFQSCLRRSLAYYNYFYSVKDLKKYVVDWMKQDTKSWTPEQVRAFQRCNDNTIPITVCSVIMAHKQGMPLRERVLEYITAAILAAIGSDSGEEVEEVETVARATVPAPTIQDRLNEKTLEQIGEMEGYYDLVITNQKLDFKPYDYFVANKVPQSQLNKFQSVYQERRAELELAQSGEDEQLKEGYHYRAADFKRIIAFIDLILAGIEQYRGVKKATKKLRAKRPVSKEKLVAKMRYLKEDKSLKMVSVNPADIPGSQELWVFNVKTRKLGRYVADSLTGPLSVKGTTIIGFDAAKSVAKTVRKPDEKLKEFMKAGKIQLRKFLDDIKAQEIKLTGRIGTDVLLLRVQ